MYDTHFGLTGRPFQLTPDPRFWFETQTHAKAMAYLGYGLAQGEGFIVVTGDIGAGKTTLIGHLLDTIDRSRLHAVKLVSTAVEADDLLRIVATELGVDPAGLAKAQLLTAIERGLHAVARTGRRVLLVVDEAQALPVSALEELRMLSNFQAGGHALLQIMLSGQPEFRDRLQGEDRLEQLRQRVIAIHHLDPMEEDEVADYVGHRLRTVGWQGNPDFAEDAFPALHAGSGGVPRRLNLLAGRVMLHAAVEGVAVIDRAVVETVIEDLEGDLPRVSSSVANVAAPTHPRHAGHDPASIAPREQKPVAPAEAWTPDQVRGEDVVEEPVVVPQDVQPPQIAAVTVADRRDEEADLLDARIAALETRVEEQDGALRRVLTLLVDWVEADAARAAVPETEPEPRSRPEPAQPVPIRGAAAWDHAA